MEGWATLDCDTARNPTYVCRLPEIDGVPTNYWHEIEWIHGPASLEPWKLPEALDNLRSLLTPAGTLVMETPDARAIAAAWYGNPACQRWVFGDPSHKDPAYMNRWAYTPDDLSEILAAVGFCRIEVKQALHHLPGRDFRIEARR